MSLGDPAFLGLLAEAAANKPTNPDIYTGEYADFADTFARVLGDPALPHLFFIEGGALAVENALKCAFDWKSRHNEMQGRSPELGTRAIHLTRAFHGRGGYTLSLTNTDPVKTERFPKFDWPRIEVPAIIFPLDEHLPEVEAAERRALAQAEAAFRAYPHDIACFVAEPIQGEGGDNHMRPEFLQAMQRLCQDNDALFVLDEVQTGVGADRHAVGLPAAGPGPGRRSVRQEGAARRDHGRDAGWTRSPRTCSPSAAGSTRPGAAGWPTWSAAGGCSKSSSVTSCSTGWPRSGPGSSANWKRSPPVILAGCRTSAAAA